MLGSNVGTLVPEIAIHRLEQHNVPPLGPPFELPCHRSLSHHNVTVRSLYILSPFGYSVCVCVCVCVYVF